jgi:hypothetical protein
MIVYFFFLLEFASIIVVDSSQRNQMEHPHHSIFLISCLNLICLCKLLLIHRVCKMVLQSHHCIFFISCLNLICLCKLLLINYRVCKMVLQSHHCIFLEFSFIIVINDSQGDQMNFLQICHFIFFIFCSILLM